MAQNYELPWIRDLIHSELFKDELYSSDEKVRDLSRDELYNDFEEEDLYNVPYYEMYQSYGKEINQGEDEEYPSYTQETNLNEQNYRVDPYESDTSPSEEKLLIEVMFQNSHYNNPMSTKQDQMNHLTYDFPNQRLKNINEPEEPNNFHIQNEDSDKKANNCLKKSPMILSLLIPTQPKLLEKSKYGSYLKKDKPIGIMLLLGR